MNRVVVWNPSDDGPTVWRACQGDLAEVGALAFVSGVCTSGSMVAAVFDGGRSIVVIGRDRLEEA